MLINIILCFISGFALFFALPGANLITIVIPSILLFTFSIVRYGNIKVPRILLLIYSFIIILGLSFLWWNNVETHGSIFLLILGSFFLWFIISWGKFSRLMSLLAVYAPLSSLIFFWGGKGNVFIGYGDFLNIKIALWFAVTLPIIYIMEPRKRLLIVGVLILINLLTAFDHLTPIFSEVSFPLYDRGDLFFSYTNLSFFVILFLMVLAVLFSNAHAISARLKWVTVSGVLFGLTPAIMFFAAGPWVNEDTHFIVWVFGFIGIPIALSGIFWMLKSMDDTKVLVQSIICLALFGICASSALTINLFHKLELNKEIILIEELFFVLSPLFWSIILSLFVFIALLFSMKGKDSVSKIMKTLQFKKIKQPKKGTMIEDFISGLRMQINNKNKIEITRDTILLLLISAFTFPILLWCNIYSLLALILIIPSLLLSKMSYKSLVAWAIIFILEISLACIGFGMPFHLVLIYLSLSVALGWFFLRSNFSNPSWAYSGSFVFASIILTPFLIDNNLIMPVILISGLLSLISNAMLGGAIRFINLPVVILWTIIFMFYWVIKEDRYVYLIFYNNNISQEFLEILLRLPTFIIILLSLLISRTQRLTIHLLSKPKYDFVYYSGTFAICIWGTGLLNNPIIAPVMFLLLIALSFVVRDIFLRGIKWSALSPSISDALALMLITIILSLFNASLKVSIDKGNGDFKSGSLGEFILNAERMASSILLAAIIMIGIAVYRKNQDKIKEFQVRLKEKIAKKKIAQQKKKTAAEEKKKAETDKEEKK